MRIAITGASGFIGTELLKTIGEIDSIEIVALTRGSTVNTAPSNCIWETSDYSSESLAQAFRNVDAVVHLAGVRGTTANPEDYKINEKITANVIEAMKQRDVSRIVFSSTISVYDDVSIIPWKEDAPLKGRTAYGDSKIQCERLIQRCASSHNFTFGIARVAQVIGEGEKRRGMMNVFIDTARQKRSLKVIGKSVAKRQYIHVKDLTEILAVMTVGNKHYSASDNAIVNVGMDDAYTNLEIAQIVNKVFFNSTPIEYDEQTAETIKTAYMDTYKLKSHFNYKTMNMEEAIKTFL